MLSFLALLLSLFVSPAGAQCDGSFGANTVCGNATGAPRLAQPTPFGSFTGGGGAVSSVTNADGTLTMVPPAGTGNVVTSLNRGHANTWTAVQTFSSGLVFSGLSTGTQTKCLGLDASNSVVFSNAACGAGGGGGIALGSPVTGPPTPIVGDCLSIATGPVVSQTTCAGGAGGLQITRAQIATTNTGGGQFLVTGYLAPNDLGYGAPYICSGQSATSWNAIQDSVGTWCALNFAGVSVQGGIQPGWFGAKADDCATTIAAPDITAHPEWRGVYLVGACWDRIGMQEAAYAAFARPSNPGSKVTASGAFVAGATSITLTAAVPANVQVGMVILDITQSNPVGQYIVGYVASGSSGTTLQTTALRSGSWGASDVLAISTIWNVDGPNGGSPNLNLPLYVRNGKYGIDARVTLAMQGGWYKGEGKGRVVWDDFTNNDYAFFCDACSYSRFDNLSVSQGSSVDYLYRNAVAGFDWTGNITANASNRTLRVQQNTLIDFVCDVSGNGQCLDLTPTSGAQGDTWAVINPIFIGSGSDYAVRISGDNAIGNVMIGGDIQGFVHDGILIQGGQISTYNTHSENENPNQSTGSPIVTQYTTFGADVHMPLQVSGSSVTALNSWRAEDGVLAIGISGGGVYGAGGGTYGMSIKDAMTTLNDVGNWSASSSFQEGTVINGGTDNRFFMLVDSGGGDYGTISSYTGGPPFVITHATDGSAANHWVGYNVLVRYGSSGFQQQCDITASTATTITIDPACAPGVSSQTVYQILGNTGAVPPNWNAAPIGDHVNFTSNFSGIHQAAGSTCNDSGGTVGNYYAVPNKRLVGVFGTDNRLPGIYVARVTASGACTSQTGTYVAAGSWTTSATSINVTSTDVLSAYASNGMTVFDSTNSHAVGTIPVGGVQDNGNGTWNVALSAPAAFASTGATDNLVFQFLGNPGNTTMSRPISITTNGESATYFATPVTDGTQGLRWIDFAWDAVGPTNTMDNVEINGGGIIPARNMTSVTNDSPVTNVNSPIYGGWDTFWVPGFNISSQTFTTGVVTSGGAPFAVTVGTLPSCNASRNGVQAVVTDAVAPTYNGALTGGGVNGVTVPVVCTQTGASTFAWHSH